MKVIRARAMGMCFGVRDALDATLGVAEPTRTTIYGELVHNPAVTRELASRGFASLPEDARELPPAPQVLVTAHGISNLERERLRASGKVLLDTTCPLVRRAHTAAVLLQNEGYFVIIIGRPGHVEVRGLAGDLSNYAIVADETDVCNYAVPRIGIVCQTTTRPQDAERLVASIREKNTGSEIRHVDTICRPTRERQEAALELIRQVEALVVVGGHHSNNTRELVRLGEQHGLPVVHVESAEELDAEWLKQFQVVGLTAGTSTLDSTVEEVALALNQVEPCGAVSSA